MTETKRDVLLYFGDYVLRHFNTPNIIFGGEQVAEYMQRYDAALPDDLPVIPESVGGLIKVQKTHCLPLSNVLGAIYNLDILRQEPSSRVLVWVKNNEDVFSRAWVLGVWRVEETGEIVKLEAEK
ncbi:hypothetical protein MOV09_09645 [Lacticaseibacillus paracasei]|nr:hypothetical protein [Lacticaseibacillus paracasei]MDP0529099.1 hypothetical protein [Lacticaseibacillus paracasei]